MKAIILAAGVGRRLSEVRQEPKSLLRFAGRSLLDRHLTNLRGCGIEDVLVCVGYRREMIEEEIDACGARPFTHTVYNPDFTRGSVISLWAARRGLESGEPCLLMDADVLYDPILIERLAHTQKPNCFLLDRDYAPGEEPVKLCVQGDRLVEFRKRLAPDLLYDFCGESVGFFRFSPEIAQRLARRTGDYVSDGHQDEPYEEAIRDLLIETPSDFDFEDVTGIPWIEIDFPEDVARAENEIAPKLRDPA